MPHTVNVHCCHCAGLVCLSLTLLEVVYYHQCSFIVEGHILDEIVLSQYKTENQGWSYMVMDQPLYLCWRDSSVDKQLQQD